MSDSKFSMYAVKALQATLESMMKMKSKMGRKFPLKLQETTEQLAYLVAAIDKDNPKGAYSGADNPSQESIRIHSKKYQHLSKTDLLLKLAETELLLENKIREMQATSSLINYLEDEREIASNKRRLLSENKQKGKVKKASHHKSYEVKARQILDQIKNEHKITGNDFLIFRTRMHRKGSDDEIVPSEQTIRNLFKRITGLNSTKKTHIS